MPRNIWANMENVPTEYIGKAFSKQMHKAKQLLFIFWFNDKCLGTSLKFNYTAKRSKQKLSKSAVLHIQMYQVQ